MRHLLRRLFRTGTGHDSTLWPVLLLLSLVFVPSAGVVWMMRAAMENERLAVRQRLADAYQAQLEIARRRIDDQWQETLARLDAIAAEEPPAQAFAECARHDAVDAVVIFAADGSVAYPTATNSPTVPEVPDSPAWLAAERLEFAEKNPTAAAQAYETIALEEQDVSQSARARQAQARSLLRAGDEPRAIAALRILAESAAATDTHGRSLAADAELRLLELLESKTAQWQEIAASLERRLNNYETPFPPSDQRRFLMQALTTLEPSVESPTLQAEILAANYLANSPEPPLTNVIEPTSHAAVSMVRTPSGRVIALFDRSTLKQTIEKAFAEQPFPEGVAIEARDASQTVGSTNDLVTLSLAPTMPGWRLALGLTDSESFDAAADRRMTYLLVTGVVIVAITAALALLVANVLRRQSQLTKLKNDLVATVSHELKTPLASIRLLVDTLLEAEGSLDAPLGDQQRAREYLELIAKENARLSRMIDNFLKFSRMERGKHQFDFQSADAATIVEEAVAAVADRFDGVKNQLSVQVEQPLPLVGEADSLVTAIVNLLDNAWKYSDEPKRIAITARRQADRIVLSVEDNGIGLSAWSARRVFDRFYQVDQHLSRTRGGCGLGLSIVRYIIEAHGGQVAVERRPGVGTTFTISLPATSLDSEGSPRRSAVLPEHRTQQRAGI